MSAQVWQVAAGDTLLEVARLLAERRISCAVVTDGGRPVGILSERDLVREIACDPSGWPARTAGGAMTHPLHTAAPEQTVGDAVGELRRLGIRRLPVVTRAGELRGIVTQTDLLRAAHSHLQEYARDLERLVSERTAALHESERRRGDLVDLTVHDIKNWLNAAQTTVDMLTEDLDDGESLLPILQRATRGIAVLVRTLLDVNRLESGAMPLRLTEVPWSSLCDPMIAEAQILGRPKGLTVVRRGESHVIVHCDPTLIERVLLNLLDNGVNAAPAGSTIDIHAALDARGALVVRVGNRGPVIAPDVLSGLFRKYQQGGSRLGGWGLGLTFCRLAIEHHGGEIRAISPYVDGEGAAFEFTLPARPQRDARGPVAVAKPAVVGVAPSTER
jgi:signal transduction histidine kinase